MGIRLDLKGEVYDMQDNPNYNLNGWQGAGLSHELPSSCMAGIIWSTALANEAVYVLRTEVSNISGNISGKYKLQYQTKWDMCGPK